MKNYRVSSYTITVKLDNSEGKYMLIHGYTGAIDIASDKLVFYFRLKKDHIVETDIPFSKEILNELIKRGYITEKTKEEEFEYVRRLARVLHGYEKAKVRSFMFVIAYDCNFRCPYCFENSISDKGRRWSQKVFTKDMVDKAYETMRSIEPNVNLHSKTITLYGGEPLMSKNKDIVKYIVDKGVERFYSFSAITNGYDLDSFSEIIKPDIFNHLQITIDGDRTYHNKRRFHYLQGDSFDKILDNIQMALENGVRVAVRTNTDSMNFEKLDVLKDTFKEKGFYTYNKFIFESALLVGEKKENDIIYLDRKKFLEKHKKANIEGIAVQGNSIFSNIYSAIQNKQLIQFHSIGCAAQSGSYIFDSYGDIYNCWETIGKRQHIIGHYLNNLEWNKLELSKWQDRNIGVVKKCSKCPYSLFCGGSCYAKFIEKRGVCNGFPDTFKFNVNNIYSVYKKQK
jgi:uncharacterized protein